MMKNYEILHKTNDCYLIAIKSVYNVGEIIKKFVLENIQNSDFSGKIVFDLLLSSIGWHSKDRFWQFDVINGKINFNSKKEYEPIRKYVKLSNNFFITNSNLLKGSVIVNKEKLM